eukprot:TRINITY_DN1907_c0_g1_i1.p1 TRINITY_DN1907_c0_g1~~TRINITY_DN1907_c0_g1_i1.p1  ORF type:complete len:877 (+),score=136.75 TRINITY_DN1907_c0_g1_i1:214-2844(+)
MGFICDGAVGCGTGQILFSCVTDDGSFTGHRSNIMSSDYNEFSSGLLWFSNTPITTQNFGGNPTPYLLVPRIITAAHVFHDLANPNNYRYMAIVRTTDTVNSVRVCVDGTCEALTFYAGISANVGVYQSGVKTLTGSCPTYNFQLTYNTILNEFYPVLGYFQLYDFNTCLNDWTLTGPILTPSTTAPSTTAPSTTAPSTLSPSTLTPSTLTPSTLTPSTNTPSTLRPSTLTPSTLTPSTLTPSTNTPSTLRPSTLTPSTLVPSTLIPSTFAPSAVPTSAPVSCTNTTQCDDSNVCTIDMCSGGLCTRSPFVCNDSNPCTNDSCDQIAGCQYVNIHCDDSNACTLDSCNTTTGQCQHTNVVCNDNSLCTQDSCNQQTGCVFLPITCDDGNLCTVDSCVTTTGCLFTNITCQDNISCTTDSCVAGNCQYINNCNDNLPCTSDVCNSDGTCSFNNNCNDNLACTADTCTSGGCVFSNTCNDNIACTTDTCTSNGCNYTSTCNDNDSCTNDVCNPNGTCSYTRFCTTSPSTLTPSTLTPSTLVPSTTQPSTIPPVTVTPTAAPGTCLTNADCNDKFSCTSNNCNPSNSTCYFVNTCNDNKVCTVDICTSVGCSFVSNCNDANVCTQDLCLSNGNCMNTAVNCDDGDSCTTDTCDKIKGCVHTKISRCNLCPGCDLTRYTCTKSNNQYYCAYSYSTRSLAISSFNTSSNIIVFNTLTVSDYAFIQSDSVLLSTPTPFNPFSDAPLTFTSGATYNGQYIINIQDPTFLSTSYFQGTPKQILVGVVSCINCTGKFANLHFEFSKQVEVRNCEIEQTPIYNNQGVSILVTLNPKKCPKDNFPLGAKLGVAFGVTALVLAVVITVVVIVVKRRNNDFQDNEMKSK